MFKKAQAMVEMTILTGLVLATLGTLVTYVVKLNEDQYEIQNAFRHAMQKSFEENKAIAYGTWDDRRQASVGEPIIGNKISKSGAGYVMWAVTSVEGQGESPEGDLYVKVNNIEYGGNKLLKSGGITPAYYTVTSQNVSIQQNNDSIASVRAAGSGEIMDYEIDKKDFFQGRGNARARAFGGHAN